MENLKNIAKYGKLLHDNKLVIGAGGNISAKKRSSLIIKKRGFDMSLGKTSGYITVPFPKNSLKLQDKEKDLLSSETPLHVACYKSRADVKAVIHVHSPFLIAASGKTSLLESTSYEFDCILNNSVPVIDYIKPGSKDLAKAMGKEISLGANAVLMRKHGAVSVGGTILEAYLRILALERACIVFLNS